MKQILAITLLALVILAGAGRGAEAGRAAPAVDFDGVTPVPTALREPIRRALVASGYDAGAGGSLTVSVFEQEGALAHVVLVPTAVVESGWQLPLGDEQIVDIFAREEVPGQWQAYVLGETTWPLIRPMLPDAPGAREPASGATTFFFPWTGGNWWIKLGYPGWHGQNAIDFKPSDPDDHQILAPAGGTLSQVCNDGYQSILRIDHGLSYTRYIHMDANTIPAELLYETVEQGQLLGRLYDGRAIDDGYCWDSADWQFNTHCGCGTVTHLHLESSDTQIMVDGYNYADIAYASMGTPYLSHNGSPYSPFPDARFVSQDGVQSTMIAGKSYDVSLTFQNVGNAPWTDDDVLASWLPAGNLTWDRARVYFAPGETVAPGASKQFAFTITAPDTLGLYDFQWRLLDATGSPIGESSPLRVVQVAHASPVGHLEVPAAGPLAGVVPVVGWAAVDGSTIMPLEMWVDGQYQGDALYGSPRPDAGGNYGFAWQWDTTALSPGNHTLQARAVAATGESRWLPLADGDPAPLAVTVNALPAGEISFPPADALLSGVVRISGWAQVNGGDIDRVEVYVDDRLRGMATIGTGGGSSFYWDWDGEQAGRGSHTLRLRAVATTGAARWLPAAAAPDTSAIPVTVQTGPRPGDATGDGRVDGLDYVIWLNHTGSASGSGAAGGDFNGDGWVDQADLTIWQENYER